MPRSRSYSARHMRRSVRWRAKSNSTQAATASTGSARAITIVMNSPNGHRLVPVEASSRTASRTAPLTHSAAGKST
jgi:hypothetical protein